ncbi:MAG: TIGR02678 family protein [Polyangiaceae bacterium]|nr:TIGR02678 family protein [Polyangiaceae bacterium]
MTPAEIAADEQRQAVRALLATPLLRAGRDDDMLVLVRRHTAALVAFFRDELGWSLYVGTDLVRLAKVPGRVDDAHRGLVDRRGEPLSRRRYVLVALSMAALSRADSQTTLHQLAEEIVLLAKSDEALAEAGFFFALEAQADRRDLVAVILWLLDHGVLVHVDGQEEGFVRQRSDVLYRVDHEVLARLPIWRVPPTLTRHQAGERRLWELLGETPEEEAPEALRRHRLARRVVDDPVVYYDDLDEPHARYLLAVRGTVLRRLADARSMRHPARPCARLNPPSPP